MAKNRMENLVRMSCFMRRDDGKDSHRHSVWFMAVLELRENYQGSSAEKKLGSNNQQYSKLLEDQ